MRVLLDVNVILDLLWARQQSVANARAISEAAEAGRLECCAAASSLTDIYYIARRLVRRESAYRAIVACLQTLTILPVDRSIAEPAHSRSTGDCADEILIAVAETNSLNAISTRDAAGFAGASIEVVSPDVRVARSTP